MSDSWAYGPKEGSDVRFVKTLILEGGRVFWTAVEAGAGFLAAWAVPDHWFDFAGDLEPMIVGAVAVIVAAAATKLKEIARAHLEAAEGRA